MYAIYAHPKQVAIWWSAKCGCSTIKSLYYNYILRQNIEQVHLSETYAYDISCTHYRNVLTVRNPYDRIISCFMEKYVRPSTQQYLNAIAQRCHVQPNDFTFVHFVHQLYESFYLKTAPVFPAGEIHHTTPQFSEAYPIIFQYCQTHNLDFHFDCVHHLETFDSVKFVESLGYSHEELNPTGMIDINAFNRNIVPHQALLKVDNACNLTRGELLNDFLSKKVKIDYASFLSPALVPLLQAVYAIDFENISKLTTPTK